MYDWEWVSARMRSKFNNVFGTHKTLGDTERGCCARFMEMEKGSSSGQCLDLSISDVSCWVGVKLQSKVWMPRIFPAENASLTLEVLQKEVCSGSK